MLTECTQTREAVIQYSQAVAAALPQRPSSELTMLFPELRSEWHDVVCDAAQLIANNAGNDASLLRSAIGPAIEVGTDPQWRLLLKVALMLAVDQAHKVPDVGVTRDVSSWFGGVSAPATPRTVAMALPSNKNTILHPFRFRASIE